MRKKVIFRVLSYLLVCTFSCYFISLNASQILTKTSFSDNIRKELKFERYISTTMKDTTFYTVININDSNKIIVSTHFLFDGEERMISKIEPRSLIQNCTFYCHDTLSTKFSTKQLLKSNSTNSSILYCLYVVSIDSILGTNIYVFDFFIAQGEPTIQMYFNEHGIELFRVVIYNWMFEKYEIIPNEYSANQAELFFNKFNSLESTNNKIDYIINGTEFYEYNNFMK